MIKKSISMLKQFWWIVFPIGLSSWLLYLYLNCNQWPNEDCTGFIGKTVWDVLELLIIPATIAGVAAFLDRLERKTDRENADKRAEVDREIAIDNQREKALQNYFDAITSLLLVHNLRESQVLEVRAIANVKTITTLEILDSNRKSKMVSFLCNLGLVRHGLKAEPIINLRGANLIGTHLERAYLEGAYLEEAHLEEANLENAYLISAHLEKAHLVKADLKWALIQQSNMKEACLEKADFSYTNLMDANFFMANLSQAKLYCAHLEGADLRGANLENANLGGANLKGANLLGANLFNADLDGVLFEGVIMPDGIEYNPTFHTKAMFTNKKPFL